MESQLLRQLAAELENLDMLMEFAPGATVPNSMEIHWMQGRSFGTSYDVARNSIAAVVVSRYPELHQAAVMIAEERIAGTRAELAGLTKGKQR